MLRRISIEPCLNGFIVNVGCQVLAYTSIDKLIFDLNQYLRKPEETEKRIVEEEGINKRHTLNEPFNAANGAAELHRASQMTACDPCAQTTGPC